jgi:hypothetical protein
MSQIFHIFRKDVRHLWIEIGTTLVLLAVYVARTIHNWSTPQTFPTPLDVLWALVTPLVPIAWCFLIIRAVQDESLVGDRQFWITRPYEWKKLLAAKALLAAAFINVPLFIADVILLDKAGFSPGRYLPGLLWMQLLMTVFLILPAGAAGAVTSTVVQVLLCVVAIVLYLIGVVSIVAAVPNASMSGSSGFTGSAVFAIFLGVLAAVILVQYARRRAWTSRIVMFAAAAAVPTLLAATPYATFIAHAYPPLGHGEAPPVHLELQPASSPARPGGQSFPTIKGVLLQFPLQASGVALGSAVLRYGQLITIEAPDGRHWTSHWQGNEDAFWPGEAMSTVSAEVDGKFFAEEKTAAVKVHVTFALTSYHETNPREVISQAGKFSVPDVGICWLQDVRQWNGNFIQCHSPLKSPPFMAHVDPSASTCSLSTDVSPVPAPIRNAWGGAGSSEPADFGISPVDDFQFFFRLWTDDNTKRPPPGACPGTPFTIATPQEGKSVHVESELDGIHLSDYVLPQENGGGGVGSIGIVVR